MVEAYVDDVWGPWVMHDGRGCPVQSGMIVEVVFEDRFGYQNRAIGSPDGDPYSSWNWTYFPELKKIIRYRIKRPKGLALLQELAENLDVPEVPEKARENQNGRPEKTARV